MPGRQAGRQGSDSSQDTTTPGLLTSTVDHPDGGTPVSHMSQEHDDEAPATGNESD